MKMKMVAMPERTRLARLQSPSGRARVVLDTDTYNEIDDQFALVYALQSPEKLLVEAIYAAPFHNERSSGAAGGMEKSYEEIQRLLELMNLADAPPVFKGSRRFLDPELNPERSGAARDLVERAMAGPEDDPLYVVAIGALSNVASAILMEPRIMTRMVVIWLGGHAFHWPDAREFNLRQDVVAAQILFDCGVPLVLVPCKGVASHLTTTIPELEAHVAGRGQIGDYLVQIVKDYQDEHFALSKVIWDAAAVAYLINPAWTASALVHSPLLSDQGTWSVDHNRHFIRAVYFVNRDPIFRDMFSKLAAFSHGL
jgi:inosine-uridine nucleoside N-ribohydrolase